MHHLILVREYGAVGGAGCCGPIGSECAIWETDRRAIAERRAMMVGVGEIRGAVRREFGAKVEVTIIDPRNFVTFIPMVIRDAVRNRVPLGAFLRAVTSMSLSTAVFDGQLLFSRTLPSAGVVVNLIRGRMNIDRVGNA